MKKSLFILIIGSILIVSGCNAKDDLSNNESVIREDKIETAEVANTDSRVIDKEQPKEESARDDVKAPNFKLAKINGEEFNLTDLKGKVIMLNFWGTWCPPCRKEIPDLINLQNKYNKEGLEIVGITLNSGSAEDIQKFAKQKNMNYTLLTDFNNNEAQAVTYLYGQAIGQQISSIPTTLIIDREGYIVKGYLGPRSEEVFYNDLKEYL